MTEKKNNRTKKKGQAGAGPILTNGGEGDPCGPLHNENTEGHFMIEEFPASQTMHSVFYFIRKKQDNSMRISLTEKKITRNKKKRQPALGLALP